MSNRIKDPSAIEARLLELAHTTDVTITAAALAYYAPCSIDDATAVLDALAARDRVSMDIEDDGTVVYRLLGRQKIAARPLPAPAATPRALVPVVREHREASPTLAALLTLFVPGAGHLYAGRFVAAVLWFLVVGAGYALILPGLILHLFSMVSAASAAHQLNVGRRFELASAY